MTTSQLSDTSSCPTKYLKLRAKIEILISRIPCGSYRPGLRHLLKTTFPELWLQVDLKSHGSYDLLKLFHILCIPTSKPCKVCGNSTDFNTQSLRPRDFCSTTCVSRSKDLQVKRESTCFKNFGVKNASQSKRIQELKSSNSLKRTGFSHNSKDPIIKEKKRLTSQRRNGTNHWFLTKTFRKQVKKTCQLKYGTDHSSQAEAVKAKFRQTNIERRGVSHPMQDPEVLERTQRSAHKLKLVTLPSGEAHSCRGYEPEVLKFLDSHPLVGEITTKVNTYLLPTVDYRKASGKWGRYYPDIGVQLKDGRHLIIEVKSFYTLWNWEGLNRLKFAAATRLARTLERCTFWLAVYDPKSRTIDWIK